MQALAAAGAGAGLAGCGGGSDAGDGAPTDEPDTGHGSHELRFEHGVASGDPLADRVVLWTRATPARDGPLAIEWELAFDAGFAALVRRGTATTDAGRDYTVKVDADGLAPGTVYHYRFRHGDTHSPVGRTKTLPIGHVEQIRLAVFSCANLAAGWFHAYADAAQRDDLDAALHLGDYLYEDGPGTGVPGLAALRPVEPAHELLSLDDYRTRYAQYRGDPDLQALHAALPMIAIWDDHEIADDAWRGGAAAHDADEGSFADRRAAALRAYVEWMPIRLPDPSVPEQAWRRFDFGDLVSLHLLETRVAGRERQRRAIDYLSLDGGFDAARYAAEVEDPDRQLLGREQQQWLLGALAESNATWQILGQQVLMARMHVPIPLLANLLGDGSQGLAPSSYLTLLARALAAPGSLSPADRALLNQPALPYNLDAWDGYPAARESVFAAAASLGRNLVALAGDTHNAWASDLETASGVPVGVEFAAASVSSPGFEAYLPRVPPAQLARVFEALVDTLRWCDTARRGYLVVTARHDRCRADWLAADTVRSVAHDIDVVRSLTVRPGTGGRRLEED